MTSQLRCLRLVARHAPFGRAIARLLALKSWRGLNPIVLLSQATLALLVAGTTALLIVQSHDHAMRSAEHELKSLALVLADQAERAFEAVDLVQTTYMEVARTEAIQTPEEFRQRMSGIEVNRELTAHGSALPQLDVVALVDDNGDFINVSRHWPVPHVNISDRDYFQRMKVDPDFKSFVSDAFINRLTHTRALVVAHRIGAKDGRFLGMSFSGVLTSYFEKLYQTVVNQDDMAISLFRGNGALLARFPPANQNLGKIYGSDTVAGRLVASNADSAVDRVFSIINGQERLVAARKLAHFPMLIAVSYTVSSILAPWRQQAAMLIAAAVVVEGVVAAVGLLMLRQLRNQHLLAQAHAELALGREREQADRKLGIQNRRFTAALGNMSQALCMFDASDSLVVGNDRLAGMLGLDGSCITPGLGFAALGALLQEASTLSPGDRDKISGLISRLRLLGRRGAHIQDLNDGRTLAVNYAPMDENGWLITFEDITELRLVEAKIAHMAHHDALTDLANRVLFHQRLNDAVARSRHGQSCAVLCLDLDHFKAVNDTLGHPVGDSLLREVAGRLRGVVRDYDTIARLGGDEFAILQARFDHPDDSKALAERLIETIGAPYEIHGHRIIIGTSIGIAMVPQDGQDPDSVMKNADMALYQSKGEGRGRYRFFAPEMDRLVQARRKLDLDLRRALAEDEFELYYQPLVNIATRAVCGFEALLRWAHPELGMVSPADFIPMAEENGLIVPLGTWVLRRACADAAAWPGRLKVAVNLSPVQFGNASLVEDVVAALTVSGLDPCLLELEITETAMLADTNEVLATLHRLRELNVGIALDDFGTGYSSLSYLTRFPFTKVKIDRSFVMWLGQTEESATIVAAIVDLCNRLGMSTIAEGVETEAQLQRLAAFHCIEAQGYLFSRPEPVRQVPRMLGLEPIRDVAAMAG